ncbi:hypothetical protein PoB_006109700 [Plakobranchus ocellatus]|uniref:Uncharacterized protein n=1 Tax=Plakobranchus ocellatus TaxID=259542 RepID=A0AAV4CRT8_9GAST|nr:hypothetical protein PoB_006109700 [Plakobranchus ocellatus]
MFLENISLSLHLSGFINIERCDWLSSEFIVLGLRLLQLQVLGKLRHQPNDNYAVSARLIDGGVRFRGFLTSPRLSSQNITGTEGQIGVDLTVSTLQSIFLSRRTSHAKQSGWSVVMRGTVSATRRDVSSDTGTSVTAVSAARSEVYIRSPYCASGEVISERCSRLF